MLIVLLTKLVMQTNPQKSYLRYFCGKDRYYICRSVKLKKISKMLWNLQLFIVISLHKVGGLGASFSPSYPVWVFFRWVMAFGSLGMKTAKCIMGVEMVGGRWRSIIMIGFYHVSIVILTEYCNF